MWKCFIVIGCVFIMISVSVFGTSEEDFQVDMKVISKDNMANGSVVLELTLTCTGKDTIWVTRFRNDDLIFTPPEKWVPRPKGKLRVVSPGGSSLMKPGQTISLSYPTYLQDYFSQTTPGDYKIPFVINVNVHDEGMELPVYDSSVDLLVQGELSIKFKPFDKGVFSKYVTNLIKSIKRKPKPNISKTRLCWEMSSLTNHPLQAEFIDLLKDDSLEDIDRYPIRKGLAEILVNFKKPLPVEIKSLPKKDIAEVRYEMTNTLVARLQSDSYDTRLEAATACEVMGIRNKRLVKPLTALLEDPKTKSKNLTERIQQILEKCTPATKKEKKQK